MVAASVLSGNRNFEARIHGAVKANFLMSPPLVVAFALAGRIDIDMEKEPLGHDKEGKPVFLRDIWPTSHEIQDEIKKFLQPSMFKERYAHIMQDNPVWQEIAMKKTAQYGWDPKSTYIQKPPYFEKFGLDLPPQKKLKERGKRTAMISSTERPKKAPARARGGGGHRRAAGFSTTLELDELIAFLRSALAAQLHAVSDGQPAPV